MSNAIGVLKGLKELSGAASHMSTIYKNLKPAPALSQPAIAGVKGLLQHAGAIGLVAGGTALAGVAIDQFKLQTSYQKMLQLYPELQRENPERVKLYFDSIANSSPSVAQQPLVAGSLIKRLINYDGFDHSVHKDLVSAQSSLDKNRTSAQGNLLTLANIGLSHGHTYRFGR